MQELQILPYDQCFAAFGDFLDSDTKQNRGSTVRKYSITNAYSVSPCSTSTDIDCRSSWRLFLVWISLIRAGEVKRKTDGEGGQGKREKILTAFSPYPLPIVFFFFRVRSRFSFRSAASLTSWTSKEKTQKKNTSYAGYHWYDPQLWKLKRTHSADRTKRFNHLQEGEGGRRLPC